MPLTLVTGPANAEKARVVLDAYAGAVGDGGVLVVPTLPDVRAYGRELAARGIVFGARVERFAWLEGELARRGGVRERAAGPLTRERVVARALERTELRVLGASAGTPGFARAFLRLCDELAEQRVEPGRWYAAVRAWGADAGREDYAEDLGALYGAYRRGLAALGRVDPRTRTALALDAVRLDPARWRGRPVLLYGFDDLTRQQLDVVETLAVHAGAPVTVSLPYEPGRAAFAGRDTAYQELLALGARETALPARDEHYAPHSRRALHHLERRLFEPEPGGADAGDALLLLQGGGPRAELELVGAHVARLLRDGVPAGEVAVVLNRPETQASLIERVFTAHGIPHAISLRIPVAHTALGRGVLGLVRVALEDGTADDVLAYLRTPGRLRVTGKADRLEVELRRLGEGTGVQARERWEATEWRLDAVDRVAAAGRAGPRALCERIAAEAEALLTAAHAGTADVLTGAEALDARVAAVLRTTLAELGTIVDADPALAPTPAELVRLLGALEVFTGESAGPDVVTVAGPLAVRARRVRALFACGLQEGVWPKPARPEPFLSDGERRALNTASGLRLRGHEDALGSERYLLYAATSRPTDLLALSWHTADEDGDPTVRSLFVDDVLDAFDDDPAARVQVRALGAAGFEDAALAPTRRELERAAAAREEGSEPADVIAPLRDPAVLAALAARETWSASGLEAWLACPVKWFVERWLRPEPLVPDPEPMVRGELAHKVLEDALGALATGGGGRPLGPEHLDEAKRGVHAALARHAERFRISPNAERATAALHRLEMDLLRYLEWAAHSGSAYAPAHLELRFGGAEDERGAVAIADGLRLQGRIDRIDLGPAAEGGTDALIYDYKGKTATAGAKWEADGRLQLALYMLALPELLGVEAAGGLYQPLGSDSPRPRGLLREDADPDLDAVRNDRLPPAEVDAALAGARRAAVAAVAEIRAGRMAPRPATCGWRDGGCSYPSICRCEAA